MFLHKRSVLFIILFLFLLSVSTVEYPWASDLDLWVDYASFTYAPDTTRSYVEIYYALDRKQLEFYPQKEGAFASVIELQLEIVDSLDQVVEDKEWKIASTIKELREIEEKEFLIIDFIPVLLSPGKFSLELVAQDLNSKKQGGKIMGINVPDYNKEELLLSQIELAFQVEPDTGTGKFVKGIRKVMPNPTQVFSTEERMLYFYSEVYNLEFSPEKDKRYSLSFHVLDSAGNKFKSFGSQILEKPGSSSVVTSGINISTLPAGDFYLEIEVMDFSSGQRSFSSKEFRVIKNMPPQAEEETITTEEVEKIRDEISYIATQEELDLFDQLNLTGKKGFLIEFWRKRDPYPDTPENEFKIKHYQRWNYANQMFSRTSQSGDGWKTDMGRVYVQYGEPDERERHPLGTELKPWEKWSYHNIDGDLLHRKQSGVFFIFVDESGFGVYRLVHSNAVGEIYDSDWEEEIRLDSSQG